MIRVAIDSDRLEDLPAGVAPLLLTYADLVPGLDLLRALEDHHKGSEIVLFDRGLGDPLGLASIADVERFSLTPAQLPRWFDRKTNQGIAYLTVYCNQVTLPFVEDALRGTPYQDHWRHVARLDGIWTVPGFEPLHRPALVQVADSSMLGIHADGSMVLNPGWHPAPPGRATEPLSDDRLEQLQARHAELDNAAGVTGTESSSMAGTESSSMADPFPPESRPRPA